MSETFGAVSDDDRESLRACREVFEAGFRARLQRNGDGYKNPYVQADWEDALRIWRAAIEFDRRQQGRVNVPEKE